MESVQSDQIRLNQIRLDWFAEGIQNEPLGKDQGTQRPGCCRGGKESVDHWRIASLFGAVGHLDLSETRYALNSSDSPAFSYI